MTRNANGGLAFVIIDSDLEANDVNQFRSKTSYLSKTSSHFAAVAERLQHCRRWKLALRFGLRWALPSCSTVSHAAPWAARRAVTRSDSRQIHLRHCHLRHGDNRPSHDT